MNWFWSPYFALLSSLLLCGIYIARIGYFPIRGIFALLLVGVVFAGELVRWSSQADDGESRP